MLAHEIELILTLAGHTFASVTPLLSAPASPRYSASDEQEGKMLAYSLAGYSI